MRYLLLALVFLAIGCTAPPPTPAPETKLPPTLVPPEVVTREPLPVPTPTRIPRPLTANIDFTALNDAARATTPTLIPWTEPTAIPSPAPAPTRIWKKTPTQTPTPAPTPTLVPTPTPIPLVVSDGVSAIPLIERAWELLDSGVDADGIYLSMDHQRALLEGITDYYALDFERRCLTTEGIHPKVGKVVDLDFPGNVLYLANSKYKRYSGASSFSKGHFSTSRRGDWASRVVEWTIFYPAGAADHLDRTWHYMRVRSKISAATCEPLRDSYSGQFFSVMSTLDREAPEIYVNIPGSDCNYNPIRQEELGRREDIDLRLTECRQGHFSSSLFYLLMD